MICKYCDTEHPRNQIANPHYCIARMEERIETLVEGLKRLQWWIERDGVNAVGVESPYHYCIVCDGCRESDEGHDEDCWLAALLRRP